MRFVVNDIAASQGGAMTILKQFYHFICSNDTENEWIFLLGDAYLKETSNIKVVCFPRVKGSKWRKIKFDCLDGKKFVASLQPDAVLSMQNIITFGVKCPQYVYIHQSIPFQESKRYSFLKSEERAMALIQYGVGALIRQSAKKADRVIVQTNWMRDAVSKKAKIDRQKIITAFPEVERFAPRHECFRSNRFFYPTICEPYKNIDLILQACDLLNGDNIHNFEVRLTLSEKQIAHPNVKCVGYLNRDQMAEEYRCGTLLFPSYIETIGLPMLEARSCETIVLAAQTPFARECLSGYENAYFYAIHDAVGLAEYMKSVINQNIRPHRDCQPAVIPSGWKRIYELLVEGK